MGRHSRHSRHRLGKPGLVHCRAHGSVAQALAGGSRHWFATLLVPARHSPGASRRRSPMAVARRIWTPAAAQVPVVAAA
jgi:hypothetical protein